MSGNDSCDEFMPATKFTKFNYWSMVLSWSLIPVAFFGLIGNSLIIKVRIQPSMRSSVNLLMIGLAVADAGMLFFASLAILPMGLYDYYPFVSQEGAAWKDLEIYTVYASVYVYPIALMFHTASIYVLALITIERYIGLCYPFKALSLCSMRNAKTGLVAVALFSIVYNVPRFFEYDFRFVNGTTEVVPGPAKMYLGHYYGRVYQMWLYLILMFAIPFFLMLSLNIRIFMALRASRQRRADLGMDSDGGEHSTTIMLCVVTIIFLVANTLPFALRIYSVTFCEQILAALSQRSSRPWEEIMLQIENLARTYPSDLLGFLLSLSTILVSTSSAINFPIYCVFSERFRQALRKYGPIPPWTYEAVNHNENI